MKHVHVPILAIILAMVMPAQAGVVTNSGDTGPGSLRGEIASAAPGDTITFAPALDGATITLAGGQLTIDKDLAIEASGLANQVTIDGNGAATHQRVLQIAEGANVVLDSLVITGGTTPDVIEPLEEASGGGGIHNAGTLAVRNSTIRGNSTGRGGESAADWQLLIGGAGGAGGGIFNSGDLTMENVTVSGNSTGRGGDGIGGYIEEVNGGSYFGSYDVARVAEGGPGGSGAGISNHGRMVLENVTVTGNVTGRGGPGVGDPIEVTDGILGPSTAYPRTGVQGAGGGIRNHGILILRESTVSGNTTEDAGEIAYRSGDGGGVLNTGTLTVERSVITGNVGGGGLHAAGTVTIERSMITGNTGNVGGGLHAAGDVTIERSTIFGNTARMGGGMHVAGGFLTMDHSTVSANASRDGGGIHAAGGSLTIDASTISGNRTSDGIEYGGSGAGVFIGDGSLTLRNSTIAENETGDGGVRGGSGAGVFQMGGTVSVISSTISSNATGEGGNLGGGVGGVYAQGGTLTIENAIIAGNHAGTGDPNLERNGASFREDGHNATSGDPMLAPLGFYGGPTRTMPPYPGSPAINTGVATGNTPVTDQCGRPRIVGGGLDLGAVEIGDTGYAAWALASIPRGLDASFDGDPNGDGISNGMAYGTGSGGAPALSRGPGGVELSFGYRPEAETDLIWKVVRSNDLQSFTEILRITGGVPTTAPGSTLAGAPPSYTLHDENSPSGTAYYRLEVELAEP